MSTDNRQLQEKGWNRLKNALFTGNAPISVIFTSALNSDHSSKPALEMAKAFLSEPGRSVLVIGADEKTKDLDKQFASPEFVTLADLAKANNRDALDKEQLPVIESANGTVIYYLAGGDLKEGSLSAEYLKDLITENKPGFDAILIDGPAVLSSSNFIAWARASDARILNVSAEKTAKKKAKQAIREVKRLGMDVTGAILTDADPRTLQYEN